MADPARDKALSELVARVRGLTGPEAWECRWQDRPEEFCSDAWVAFRDAIAGSLDAAERFRQVVLPGSAIDVLIDSRTHATLWRFGETTPYCALHISEPIARVLAVLTALEAAGQ